MTPVHTRNDDETEGKIYKRFIHSANTWCSRAQPKPKSKPRPPKPAKPNSNSAKRHKPFGQADRRSLAMCHSPRLCLQDLVGFWIRFFLAKNRTLPDIGNTTAARSTDMAMSLGIFSLRKDAETTHLGNELVMGRTLNCTPTKEEQEKYNCPIRNWYLYLSVRLCRWRATFFKKIY
jgi:hypothetical protein